MLRQKKGLLTVKAILGLILGVIIVVVLVGVWMQVLRLLPSETTFDEASTKNYDMLVSRVNSLIEEDKEGDSIPFYLNKEYFVVGFNEGEEKIGEKGMKCYEHKFETELLNPCETSCLCLCKSNREKPEESCSNAICNKKFSDVTFKGSEGCGGYVVLLSVEGGFKGLLSGFQKEPYNVVLNKNKKVIEIIPSFSS